MELNQAFFLIYFIRNITFIVFYNILGRNMKTIVFSQKSISRIT